MAGSLGREAPASDARDVHADDPSARASPGLGADGVRAVAVAVGALVAATVAAAVLESVVGVADASPVYLVAVVTVAAISGTWPAVATSIAAFLAYDFLFTTPRLTFAVADPAEWLSLVLFLVVAVAIGRLTALVRERAEEADRRVRESVSLVAISRAVAMAPAFNEAAAEAAARLCVDAEMAAVRVTALDESGETTVAEAGSIPSALAGEPWTLLQDTAAATSDWVRILPGTTGAAVTDVPGSPPRTASQEAAEASDAYVVPIESDGTRVGTIHAFRDPGSPRPGRGARRILALAADQLGTAALRDALREELTAVEVGRRSDALRAAILDSVSHDLRTPLSSIRALAGRLADPEVELEITERRATAAAIDAEAERLADLVRSLIDMSRIQAGAVHPDLEAYDPGDLADTTVRRVRAATGRRVDVRLDPDLPAVLVDAVLLDVALGNVLENATRHTPPAALIQLTATVAHGEEGDLVLLAVDDAGPGVPDDAMPRLFERFYRARTDATGRPGLGMGLAIARGFAEAMGAGIDAEPSELGGLRVVLALPVAPEPAGDPGPRAIRSSPSVAR